MFTHRGKQTFGSCGIVGWKVPLKTGNTSIPFVEGNLKRLTRPQQTRKQHPLWAILFHKIRISILHSTLRNTRKQIQNEFFEKADRERNVGTRVQGNPA